MAPKQKTSSRSGGPVSPVQASGGDIPALDLDAAASAAEAGGAGSAAARTRPKAKVKAKATATRSRAVSAGSDERSTGFVENISAPAAAASEDPAASTPSVRRGKRKMPAPATQEPSAAGGDARSAGSASAVRERPKRARTMRGARVSRRESDVRLAFEIVRRKLRKRQFRYQTRAQLEIQFYQETTNLLMKKLGFQRIVRSLVQKIQDERALELPEGEAAVGYRFESQALLALQEATEQFLVGYLEDANSCASHDKRVTIMERDLALSERLTGKEIS